MVLHGPSADGSGAFRKVQSMVPKGIRGRGIQRKGHPRRISGGAGCKAERLARGERRAGARRRNPDGRGCRTMAAVQVLRPSFFYGRPVRRVASATLSVVCFSAIDICTIILGLVPSTRAWRYSRTLMVGHCVHRLSTASCPFCIDAIVSCVHSEAENCSRRREHRRADRGSATTESGRSARSG